MTATQPLVGQKVQIPLNGRLIPIIADALLADTEMGTGAVKVTPAHDPNDYACFQRNPEIGLINILNPDGTINENGGALRRPRPLRMPGQSHREDGKLGSFRGGRGPRDSDQAQRPLENADRTVFVGPVVRQNG